MIALMRVWYMTCPSERVVWEAEAEGTGEGEDISRGGLENLKGWLSVGCERH